jgi:hypothetical protein
MNTSDDVLDRLEHGWKNALGTHVMAQDVTDVLALIAVARAARQVNDNACLRRAETDVWYVVDQDEIIDLHAALEALNAL